LPLTARSSSSLETPRTGGGFTARSSGEKGTPRDAQRLALGERPRDEVPPVRPEGWTGAAPPILSPQHTARSVGLSSEPWSMTPSSQGDSLSARSRLDCYSCGGLEDAPWSAMGAHAVAWHHGGQAASAAAAAEAQAAAQAAAQQGPPGGYDHNRCCLDLQKNLEVMRFVIMKENQKLKELVQQSRIAQAEAKQVLESTLAQAGASREPLQIEWFVRSIDDALAPGYWGLQEQEEFRAPELPEAGVRLQLRASPAAAHESADGVAARGAPVSLELGLEVIGRSAPGLELQASLAIETEEEAAAAASQFRGASPGQVGAYVRHGKPATTCRTWPAGACTAVCRAEVERAWPRPGEPLLLQSSTWGE